MHMGWELIIKFECPHLVKQDLSSMSAPITGDSLPSFSSSETWTQNLLNISHLLFAIWLMLMGYEPFD